MSTIIVLSEAGVTSDANRLSSYITDAGHRIRTFDLLDRDASPLTAQGTLAPCPLRDACDHAYNNGGCVVLVLSGESAIEDAARVARLIKYFTERLLVTLVYFMHSPSTPKAMQLWSSVNERRIASTYVQLSKYDDVQSLLDRVKLALGRADGKELAEVMDDGRRYVGLTFLDQDRIGLLQAVCSFAVDANVDIIFLEQKTLGPIASVFLVGRLCGDKGYFESLAARQKAFVGLRATLGSGTVVNSVAANGGHMPSYVEFNGPTEAGLPQALERSLRDTLPPGESRMTFKGTTLHTKPGILHGVAEQFALFGVNILNARVYSVNDDGATVNIIKAKANTSTLSKDGIRQLKRALEGVDGFAKKPQVEYY